MFRLVSRIFAQTTMMYLPSDGVAQNLDSCYHCVQHHSEISTMAACSSEARATPVPNELYTLPPKEEATLLLDRFFCTVNMVLPYISKSDLLEEYHKATEQCPPKFRRVLLALLNIVWAHASSSLGNPRQEDFYRRSVSLLDSRTIERPSYELGIFGVSI